MSELDSVVSQRVATLVGNIQMANIALQATIEALRSELADVKQKFSDSIKADDEKARG